MPDDTGGRPAEHTVRPPTGDGSWGAPDPSAHRTASERAERERSAELGSSADRGGSAEGRSSVGGVRSPRPDDDARVAPGWEQQSMASYEAADSGGWGGPRAAALTGPVPRIRRRDEPGELPEPGERDEYLEPQTSEPEPSDSDAVATTTFGAPPQTPDRAGLNNTALHDNEPHDTGRAGGATHTQARHDDNPHDDNRAAPADESDDGEEWRRYSAAQAAAPPSTFGVRSGRAPGFARRVTASLAPIAFWLIVGYLIVDFAAGVYALGSVAALGTPPDLGLTIVTVVAGLLKVVALGALARLGLEACLNLAELAGRHRGDAR